MSIIFSIIVAVDSKNGIGKNGQLPWHLSADMKHFKEVTCATHDQSKQNVVIMGRKTWDSISEKFRPLAGRLNVVLSRNPHLVLPPHVMRSNGLDEALKMLEVERQQGRIDSIFVIGGGEIFKEAVNHPACQKIYLTKIENDFKCDTFFPDFSKNYRKVTQSFSMKENGISFSFFEFVRK